MINFFYIRQATAATRSDLSGTKPWKSLSARALACLVVTGFMAVSCSKNSPADSDRESPVVTLTSLSDEQVFNGAQTIRIAGSVTDNRYIREIHIEVSDLATGQEYLHVHINPAGAGYSYDQPYQLAAGTDYKIRVIADDASSNSSVSTVNVRCN